MSNKTKKENLKLSDEVLDRTNFESDSLEESQHSESEFKSPVKVKQTIDYYNTEQFHTVNAFFKSEDVKEIKNVETHELTLDFEDNTAILAIKDKAKAYERAISSIVDLFKMIETHDVGTFWVKRDDSNIIFYDENATNENKRAQIILSLGVLLKELEENVAISICRFLEYSVTLGFFGNISIKEDQNWCKLVGVCVRNAFEPLLPLLIGYYLYSIGNLYCLEKNEQYHLLQSVYNHYTKKDVKTIMLAINKINSNFKDGWLTQGNQFFNDKIFKGWYDLINEPRYHKTYKGQIVDVLTPNDIDYSYDFFDKIIDKVVSSNVKRLASDGKLKLAFKQAVEYEDTKKKS